MDTVKLRTVTLVIALTAASLLVLVLASQKRDLLDRIDLLTSRIRDPFPGLYVPAVSLPSVAGDTITLGQVAPGSVQVLFVFSTACQYCKASLPAWKHISGQFANTDNVQVVGISLDSVEVTRRYLAEQQVNLPVTSFTDPRLRALYRAGVTPQTLIVDADGRVSYARIGALIDPAAVDSVVDAARDPFQRLTNRVPQ